MKTTTKNILIFLGGAATGAISVWLGCKRYYEIKADLEVESVRKAYNDKVAEIEEDVKSSMDGDIEGPEEIHEPSEGKVYLKSGEKTSISDLLNNKPPLTDYKQFFKAKGEEKNLEVPELSRDPREEIRAEEEHPEDDEAMTDEEDAEEQAMYEMHQENANHKEHFNDPPHLITEEDYEFTNESYDKMTLLYYITDNVLVNDTGEEEDMESTVGDVLIECGFTRNDHDVVYVRNDRLSTDFEVEKVYTEYQPD